MAPGNSLADRLARLTPAQRARVIAMAAEDGTTSGSSPGAIRVTKPSHVEVMGEERIEYFPASSIQSDMWQLDRYTAGAPAYNSPSAFRLEGAVSSPALTAALDRLSHRHAILRTSFARRDGQLYQRVHSRPRYQFEELTLPAESNVAALAVEKARGPMDLENGPLMRITLLRYAENKCVLLVVLHHILTDGWSRAIFYRELAALYHEEVSGNASALSPLPFQYSDYAAWYNGTLNSKASAADRAYWKQRLSNLPGPLNLSPGVTTAPATSGFEGERQTIELPTTLIPRLQRFASEEGATLFMVLLAAFQALLHRYSCRNDLLVGVPVANRSRLEAETLIGMFIKTVPMRLAVAADSTFRSLVRQVKTTAVEAFEHSNVPLEEMLALTNNEDVSARSSLLQILFALQDFPEAKFEAPGIQSAAIDVGTRTSKVDFYVAVEPVGAGWVTRLECKTGFFRSREATRWLAAWQLLLQGVLADPDQEIAELSLVTANGAEAEAPWLLPASAQMRLTTQWNKTTATYPADRCVHELFEEQTLLSPAAVALVFKGVEFTYDDLNRRANRLSHYLRQLGIGTTATVAVAMERSVDYVVSVLAILKTGAAYVPLSPDEPAERVKHMFSDTSPSVLLVTGSPPSEYSLPGVRVVHLSTLSSTMEACSSDNPPRQATAETPAYVMFTSGSTGQPKGIAVPHRAIVRLVRAQSYARFTPGERFLLLAPLSFDASTFELWGPLLNGGTCVIYPEHRLDLRQLENFIRDERITCLWLTASLFNLVVDQSSPILLGLRHIITGGEALSVGHVRRALELNPNLQLTNGYGPTETTTFACTHAISAEDVAGDSIPIGRPIANTTIYILDEHQVPVPIGFAGEIYIGGDGVAAGYINRKDLTEQRFLADLFRGSSGGRMFRTGDRARYRADGVIEFLGRIDSQIKLRGFRIEPAEIEQALKQHPDVRECVVVADSSANPHLIAYVTANGQTPGVTDLRTFLGGMLPEYMVPAVFCVRESLPITRNGKLDRAALTKELPAPRPTPSTAPKTLLESQLLDLWKRVFPAHDVTTDDNFFALGGHSLLAVSLTLEIEKLIGRRLPIGVLFEAPTVALLARKLGAENHAPKWNSLVPLKPTGTRPPLFFIHGVRGDVYVYLPLVRNLPSDQPAYGLQAVELDGRHLKHTQIEELAAAYADEIQSFQPRGPYSLAGYSLGGWFAFAVAHELRQRGQTITMLGLLDASTIVYAPRGRYLLGMAHYLASQFAFHVRQLPQIPAKEWARHIRGRIEMLRFHLNPAYRAAAFPPADTQRAPAEVALGGAGSPLTSTVNVDEFLLMWRKYHPPRYRGDIDLFIPNGRSPLYYRDWKRFVDGSIRIHPVPGRHFTMLTKPWVVDVAASIGKALARAQNTGNPP